MTDYFTKASILPFDLYILCWDIFREKEIVIKMIAILQFRLLDFGWLITKQILINGSNSYNF
jgi:hypothetical protein